MYFPSHQLSLSRTLKTQSLSSLRFYKAKQATREVMDQRATSRAWRLVRKKKIRVVTLKREYNVRNQRTEEIKTKPWSDTGLVNAGGVGEYWLALGLGKELQGPGSLTALQVEPGHLLASLKAQWGLLCECGKNWDPVPPDTAQVKSCYWGDTGRKCSPFSPACHQQPFS